MKIKDNRPHNAAQEQPSMEIHIVNDISAWQGSVFVLYQARVVKLNDQLEVVKSVQLPLTPTPLATSSPPDGPALPGALEMDTLPLRQPVNPSDEGCVSADQRNIYVLHQSTLYVFDHELNHVKSKILAGVR